MFAYETGETPQLGDFVEFWDGPKRYVGKRGTVTRVDTDNATIRWTEGAAGWMPSRFRLIGRKESAVPNEYTYASGEAPIMRDVVEYIGDADTWKGKRGTVIGIGIGSSLTRIRWSEGGGLWNASWFKLVERGGQPLKVDPYLNTQVIPYPTLENTTMNVMPFHVRIWSVNRDPQTLAVTDATMQFDGIVIAKTPKEAANLKATEIIRNNQDLTLDDLRSHITSLGNDGHLNGGH